MDWFTLVVAAFTVVFALPVLWVLVALAPRFPAWIPGALPLTAAIVLVAVNTRPEHHSESVFGAYADLGFMLQNGVALGLAIAGAVGLAFALRSWRRQQASAAGQPAVELPTAVVERDALEI